MSASTATPSSSTRESGGAARLRGHGRPTGRPRIPGRPALAGRRARLGQRVAAADPQRPAIGSGRTLACGRSASGRPGRGGDHAGRLGGAHRVRGCVARSRTRKACPSCRRTLARGAALFRGEFLEGFALRDSAPSTSGRPWRRRRFVVSTGERSCVSSHSRRRRGASTHAIATGRRLMTLDPLDERGHRALMRVHADAGDRHAAVRVYDECVRILATRARCRARRRDHFVARGHPLRTFRSEVRDRSPDARPGSRTHVGVRRARRRHEGRPRRRRHRRAGGRPGHRG